MEPDKLLFGLIIIGLIIWYFIYRQQQIEKLKNEYDNALQGIDKKKALESGRKYYAALRNKGKLTIYDEQAITNDLVAMDDARKPKK